MTFPPDPAYPDWTFSIEEVSVGVYEVTARHKDGRSVSRKGFDEDALLAECKFGTRALLEPKHA